MEFLFQYSSDELAKKFHGCSWRRCQYIKFIPREKGVHFQVQTSLKHETQFLSIFVCYSLWHFCDLKFSKWNRQKFSWMSFQTLARIHFFLRENLAHFKVQTCPKAHKHIFYRFSFAIVNGIFVIQLFQNKMIKNFHGRSLRCCNVSSLSRGEYRRIFKFKQAPKQVNAHFVNFRVL